MKLVVDMNFGPRWVERLRAHGVDAIHWAEIGPPNAPDEQVVSWARSHESVVVTQDKGVAGRVVRTGAAGPSVIQIRNAQAMEAGLPARIAALATEHTADLERGAILVFDAARDRLRVRPLAAPLRRRRRERPA